MGYSEEAENQVVEIGRQYTEGLITQGEKYNKVVDIWAKATDDVANEMMEAMKTAPVHGQIGQSDLSTRTASRSWRRASIPFT